MDKKNDHIKKSAFITDADYRIKNKKWLRYSSNIARRILAKIEDNKEINQKILAGQLNVTPQYISKVVQGHENLSLETIAKLSEALGVELISFPQYKYSIPTSSTNHFSPSDYLLNLSKEFPDTTFKKEFSSIILNNGGTSIAYANEIATIPKANNNINVSKA